MTEKKCMTDNEKRMSERNFSAEDGTDFDLTVMTYNVQFFSGRNTENTAAQIVSLYKPDIAGIQELGSVSSSLDHIPLIAKLKFKEESANDF